MKPYYDDGTCVIYHGDCRELRPAALPCLLITDPPYPNNAGWFNESVDTAREWLADSGPLTDEALVFWSELEPPPIRSPLVAVHIWYRSNVNGRPYEPIYHLAADGHKRRSEVYRHSVPFEGGTGSSWLGHPTQKPVELLRVLIEKTRLPQAVVFDPFMGSGTTLRAAKDLGREAIGIEIEEKYCEIAAKRLAQEVLPLEVFMSDEHSCDGFINDDAGFVVAICFCGWSSRPCPGQGDAIDALMDHAGGASALRPRSGAAVNGDTGSLRDPEVASPSIIQIYETGATCSHPSRFVNGNVCYCEDCGARGEQHRNVRELVIWS